MFAGTCDGGMFIYEKTTAYFLRTARQENLPLSSNTPGITKECARLCVDQGADCPAFSIDYNGQRCFTLDRNTQVKLARTRAKLVTVPRMGQIDAGKGAFGSLSFLLSIERFCFSNLLFNNKNLSIQSKKEKLWLLILLRIRLGVVENISIVPLEITI